MSGGDGHGGRHGGARPGVHNQVSGGEFGSLIQAGTIGSLTVQQAAGRPPTPRQVPAPHRGFVNRSAELAALTAALERWSAGVRGPELLVLSGAGGIGKSALGYEWADRHHARFPDGQLHVDLAAERGRGGAVDLGAVAAGFARSLGVSADFIPADPAGRSAVYRSATAERHRLLLMIDNAEQATEVRALLPRHGMVLVTSRRPLPALRMDGAHAVAVGELDAAACRALVRSWLDESEISDATLGALVRVCGGRPLTLRAVGDRLLDGSGESVHRVVAELTADARRRRLAGAGDGGDTTVSDALTRVYLSFPAATRRLYRLLGALPGPTFPEALALGLGAEGAGGTGGTAAGGDGGDGGDGDGARAGLAALEAARLVNRLADGHYAFHDEARAHAGSLPDAGEREEALRAGVDFALAACELVDRVVLGDRLRLSGTERRPEVRALPELPTPAVALDWMERESATVLALLRAAAERGRHEPVWLMCQALWAYFHSRKPYVAWVESHLLGIEAARWAARPDAELRMINQLARAYIELGEYLAAGEALEPTGTLLEVVRQRQLRGVIHETRGLLARATGRPGDAVADFRAAKEANAGDERGMAMQGYQLASALLDLGRAGAALAELDEAAARVPGDGHAALHARIGIVRGTALRDLGRRAEAAATLATAAGLAERLGLWAKAEAALTLLIELTEPAGDAGELTALTARLAAVRRRAGVADGA